jgi:autotransporter-associated beta strand protein
VLHVESGRLSLGSAGRLSALPVATVDAGAVLALGGAETLGSLDGAGTVALGAATLSSGSAGSTTFAGNLTGPGSLVKQGASTFTLTGANSYSGSTTVAAGMLAVGSGGSSGTLGSGAVSNDGVLRFERSDSLTVANTIGGSGSLLQAGTGTLLLTADNGYGGGTTVSAGVLQLGNGGATGSAGSGAVSNDAVLRLQHGTAFTLANNVSGSGSLEQAGSGSATLAGANTYTGSTTVAATTTLIVGDGASAGTLGQGAVHNAGTLRFERADAMTVSNAIDGSGRLQQAGAGTLTLLGANTYSGATLVDAGVLQVGDGGVLGTLGSGAISNAATLRFQHSDDLLLPNAISGSGRLQQAGSGSLVLTADNSYSGLTEVLAGTLQIGNGGATGTLGSGAVVNAGVLRFARSNDLTVANDISGGGSLEQAGSGVLTLSSAANTYSGDTRVLSGTLQTSASERLPDASAVDVASGARLVLGGDETVASLQADGTLSLHGSLAATGDLLLRGAVQVDTASAIALSGQRIEAVHDGNQWSSQPLAITADSLALSSGKSGASYRDLNLGLVSLAQGGRIDAGQLQLIGNLLLAGGSLALHAHALPGYTIAPSEQRKSPFGETLAFAGNVIDQASTGHIETSAGSSLLLQSEGGGSIRLAQDANDFRGSLSVLSGAQWDTAWSNNARAVGGQTASGQGQVVVYGQNLLVGGKGIEADVVTLRADHLAMDNSAVVSAPVPLIAARLPYSDQFGTALSSPGLTLILRDDAFGSGYSFGQPGGQELNVNVGGTDIGNRSSGPDAGFLQVLPKGGARGSTAVYLVGPVNSRSGAGYRFFHDGAGKQGEIPVLYNGVLPQTPQVTGSLSAVASVSESARKDRFEEAVRTENVAVRLRSGVIAEVGPGRPATQGSEGARPPQSCTPAEGTLQCR